MTRLCPQCALYRAEIVLLKIRIEQLLLQIKKLTRRIKRVRFEMYVIVSESCAIVAMPSGVQRAKFAYHKGRCEVASKVIKLLGGG